MARNVASFSLLALLAFFLCLPALPEEPAAAPGTENKQADDPAAGQPKQQDDTTDQKDRKKTQDEKDKERKKYRDKKRGKKPDQKAQKEALPSDQQLEFKKAEKKLQSGDIIGAWSAFEPLAAQDKDKDTAKQAGDQLKQIEATGQDEVKKALALGDPDEAERQLSALHKKYWRTPVKNVIADALSQVRLKKAQKASGEPAANAPAAGAADPNAKPGAADAEQAADPDEIARMWLIVGNIHRINGRPGQARAAYNKLVYEYPDSRFTPEALRKIDELQAESHAEKPADAQGGEE